MNNQLLHTVQHAIISLKKTVADILKYFLADATVQNVLVGSVITFQITFFIVKQMKEQVKGLI